MTEEEYIEHCWEMELFHNPPDEPDPLAETEPEPIDMSELPVGAPGFPLPTEDEPPPVYEFTFGEDEVGLVDPCEDYVRPADQEPLSQSSEVVYYYDDLEQPDGYGRHKLYAEWNSTAHLPIHCKRCRAYFELRELRGGVLQRSTLDLFPSTQVQANLGDAVLEGSTLCVDFAWSDLQYPVQLQAAEERGEVTWADERALMLDAIDEYQKSKEYAGVQYYVDSYWNSTLDVSESQTLLDILPLINSNHFQQQLDNVKARAEDFETFSDVDFPDLLPVLFHPSASDFVSMNTNDPNCASYSATEVFEALRTAGQLKDVMAVRSIVIKGWGCVLCQGAGGLQGAIFSTLRAHGYTDRDLPDRNQTAPAVAKGLPTYEEFKNSDIFLTRHCADGGLEEALESDIVSGVSHPNQFVTYYENQEPEVISCHEKIKNCALCQQTQDMDVGECKMCIDGFALNTIRGEGGQVEQACMFMHCQPGERLVTNFNGIVFCEPCEIENCQECAEVIVKPSELSESQEPIPLQLCLKCETPFTLNDDQTECLGGTDDDSGDADDSVTEVRHYLIEPDFFGATSCIDGGFLCNVDEDAIIEPIEQVEQYGEENSRFYFLQQALSRMNEDAKELAKEHKEVEATIWLTKGDHFWFTCDETVERENIKTPLRHDILCSMKSLRAFAPDTDNVVLAVRAVMADDETIGGILGKRSDWVAQYGARPGDLPVIYVNQNHAYFNITKSGLFENVVFDGLNQFAYFREADDEAVESPTPTPFWPKKLCEFPEAEEGDKTPLLQLMQDLAQTNSGTEAKGYGHLPLEALADDSHYMTDHRSGEIYVQECSYTGSKKNLYAQGASKEFAGLHSEDGAVAAPEVQKEYIRQDIQDYTGEDYNHFTINEDEEELPDYQKALPSGSDTSRRRRALFNLYAFTYQDSYQKEFVPGTADTEPTSRPSDSYQIPALVLKNVAVRNFLNDSQALIYVERDNFIVRNDSAGDKIFLHFGNYKADANITIESSNISDCSFSLGMIYVPPDKFSVPSGQDTVYRYLANQTERFTDQLQTIEEHRKSQSRILLLDSRFENLNYGKSVYGLNKKFPPGVTDYGKMKGEVSGNSKGIVLSVHSFGGPIEVISSTIRHNMVFIPSAIFTNLEKPSADAFNLELNDFVREDEYDETLLFQINPEEVSYLNRPSEYFLNYYQLQDRQELRDSFLTQSCIFIENVDTTHIVFDGNTFDGNIGILGGAVHIDNTLMVSNTNQLQSQAPRIFFDNNIFTRNMAYFEGNAIYIKAGDEPDDVGANNEREDLQVVIQDCTFEKNYGLNIAQGAAVSIDGVWEQAASTPSGEGEEIEIQFGKDKERSFSSMSKLVAIDNCRFDSNPAGQSASAINLVNIKSSRIELSDLDFQHHTGAFSWLERELEAPYYEILTSGKYLVNFYNNGADEGDTTCQNEISMIGTAECLFSQDGEDDSGSQKTHINYPHMRGVIYLYDTSNVTISDCTFTNNDPGPIFSLYQDKRQILDPNVQSEQLTNQVNRASGIYIAGEVKTLSIDHCTFKDNTIDWMQQKIKDDNEPLLDYFPGEYFDSSHSPLINVLTQEIDDDDDDTAGNHIIHISDCTFEDQRHSQVQGLADQSNYNDIGSQYHGSLLQLQSQDPNLELSFTSNTVNNWIFKGKESALIDKKFYGSMKFIGNTLTNIGYIQFNREDSKFTDQLPIIEPTSTEKSFEFSQDEIEWRTTVGIFNLQNTIFKGSDQVHTISGNSFKGIVGAEAAIYYIHDNTDNQNIKIMLEDNEYVENYGIGSSIMSMSSSQTQNPDLALDVAIIQLQNERVVDNTAIGTREDPYPKIYQIDGGSENMQTSIIVRDSQFISNRYILFQVHYAAFYMDNCTISNRQDAFVTAEQQTEEDPEAADADQTPSPEETDTSFDQSSSHQPVSDNHMSNEIQEMLEDETKNRISTSPGSDQKYNVFVLKKSLNVWILGYNERQESPDDDVEIYFGQMTGPEIFAGFHVDTSDGTAPEITFPGDDEAIQKGSQISDTTIEGFALDDTVVALDNVFQIEQHSLIYMSDCTIRDIDSRIINIESESQLAIRNFQEVSNLGTNIPFFSGLQPANEDDITARIDSIIDNTLDTTVSLSEEEYSNGFLKASSAFANIYSSKFDNIASKQALIYASDQSEVRVWNSSFDHIIGVEQAALIHAIQNSKGDVIIQDTTIENSLSKAGLISLNVAKITIERTEMRGNYARIITNGISMINSEATLTDCVIDNLMNNLGVPLDTITKQESGFVNMNYQSRLDIKNTSVYNLIAQVSAFIQSNGQSSVSITEGSLIKNCTSDNSCLMIRSPLGFSVSGTNFEETNGIFISRMNGEYLIEDTGFTAVDRTQLHTEYSDGEIRDCRFKRSADTTRTCEEHSAVIIEGADAETTIRNTSFENLASKDMGGAIAVQTAKSLTISDSTFTGNTAKIGGAVDLDQVSETFLTNNRFENNSAELCDREELDDTLIQDSLKGGALNIDCIKEEGEDGVVACATYLGEGNSFSNNYAQIRGGAISYSSQGIIEEDDSPTQYDNNTAGYHSLTVSAFPDVLVYEWDPAGAKNETIVVVELDDLARAEGNENKLEVVKRETLAAMKGRYGFTHYLTVPSGQDISVVVRLQDSEGNLQAHENSATISARLIQMAEWIDDTAGGTAGGTESDEDGDDPEGDTHECQLCQHPFTESADFNSQIIKRQVPAGEEDAADTDGWRIVVQAAQDELTRPGGNKPSLRNAEGRVANGTMTLPSLVVTQYPGAFSVVTFDVQGLSENGLDPSFRADPVHFLVYARPCVSGEEYTNDGRCSRCRFGEYLLVPPDRPFGCKQCDSNAHCYGGNETAPRAGYFRQNVSAEEIIECIVSEVCLGGSQDEPLGVCAEGHEGYMCVHCVEGYYMAEWLRCNECPDQKFNVIFTAIKLFWFTSLIYLVASLSESIQNGNNKNRRFLNLFKLIVNHFSVLYCLNQIDCRWDGVIATMVKIELDILRFFTDITHYRCLLTAGLSSPGTAPSVGDLFYHQELMILQTLFLIWILAVVIFFMAKQCANKSIRDKAISKAISIIIITLWLIYPDVCLTIFSSFSCMQYGDQPPRLYKDMEIECWDEDHLQLVLSVSAPATLIWIIGIPWIFYRKLKQYEDILKDSQCDDIPSEADRKLIKEIKIRYGFLSCGYARDFFFWEIAIMLRKAIIALAAGLAISLSPTVQCLVCIIIVVGSLMVGMQTDLYETADSKQDDAISQLVHMLRIYIGLFYVAGSDNPYLPYLRLPFASVALLPSLLFLVRCLQRLAIELLLRSQTNTSQRLFKILTCHRIDPEKFRRDHDPSTEFDAGDAVEKPGHPHDKRPAALDRDEPEPGDIDLGRGKLVEKYEQAKDAKLDPDKNRDEARAGSAESSALFVSNALKQNIRQLKLIESLQHQIQKLKEENRVLQRSDFYRQHGVTTIDEDLALPAGADGIKPSKPRLQQRRGSKIAANERAEQLKRAEEAEHSDTQVGDDSQDPALAPTKIVSGSSRRMAQQKSGPVRRKSGKGRESNNEFLGTHDMDRDTPNKLPVRIQKPKF